MAYYPGQWSITGEEQLGPSDHSDGTKQIEKLFLRALVEEIFHLRTHHHTATTATKLDEFVDYMRILSLGVEWPEINPSLFGVVQLSINPNELRDHLRDQKSGVNAPTDDDPEGSLWTITEQEAIDLLFTGEGTATGLFNKQPERMFASQWHPTTRYRLYRLLRTTRSKELLKRANLGE